MKKCRKKCKYFPDILYFLSWLKRAKEWKSTPWSMPRLNFATIFVQNVFCFLSQPIFEETASHYDLTRFPDNNRLIVIFHLKKPQQQSHLGAITSWKKLGAITGRNCSGINILVSYQERATVPTHTSTRGTWSPEPDGRKWSALNFEIFSKVMEFLGPGMWIRMV